jgi:predicted metal-dependent TIM-barrel fold hydrolase/sugar phosphate isomerase/epimerase
MRIFDPHIHMTSRTTDDYERMAAAGVRAVLEPAFWLGQPRTNIGSFADYFDALVGWEPFRAGQYGIHHHCALALNPKEANDPRCRGVLDLLPRYLAKDGVVAVGEIGYDMMTAQEDEAFAAQLDLALRHRLPALVHTPHRDKPRGTERSLRVVKDSGIEPALVVLDHLNELTVRAVADSGCWMGFSVYPDTKMSAERMVAILGEYGPRTHAGQLRRRLGPQRPAVHRARRAPDARSRVRERRRGPGAVAQPGRVLRPVGPSRPGRRTRERRCRRTGRDVRGQHDRARWLMRFAHRDGQAVHLGYCTNVHAAESLPDIVAQLDLHAVAVRERLGADRLGVGLWLPAPAAAALAADPAAVRRLRGQLEARGLETVTLNGFPYQAFHAPVVKHAVYRPDWTSPRRLDYALDLAVVLSGLLPEDAARGSVSTLPLAWRTTWDAARGDAARRGLDTLARRLRALHRDTGRAVRIAFEPEPGCVVESTAQAATHLAGVDPEYLGVCVDLAHLACAWEQPSQAFDTLTKAGLPIVKVQLSAALVSDRPQRDAHVLNEYAEPRFLHQVRSAAGPSADDLDEALIRALPRPWRIHYHVPLHAEPLPPLGSTADVLRDALGCLLGGPAALCDHLEVETYTWSVLPPAQRPHDPDGLARGIAAELAFARDELRALDLSELNHTAAEPRSR